MVDGLAAFAVGADTALEPLGRKTRKRRGRASYRVPRRRLATGGAFSIGNGAFGYNVFPGNVKSGAVALGKA
jgi:hypothetical protein